MSTGNESMKLCNARAVHAGLVMPIVYARIRRGGTFATSLPMVNEICTTNTTDNWGQLLGNPKDGDQLLGGEVHTI